MAALSISSVLISYILITQSLVYCLRKKCKIYYSLYCTTTCIISRDESLNSVDYNGIYARHKSYLAWVGEVAFHLLSLLLSRYLFMCVHYSSYNFLQKTCKCKKNLKIVAY
jgi:hypothetical protein